MIVDDCLTNPQENCLGHYLEVKGIFPLYLLKTALDALEKLSAERVNLIMTDLNMPVYGRHGTYKKPLKKRPEPF